MVLSFLALPQLLPCVIWTHSVCALALRYWYSNDYSHSTAPHPGFRDTIAAYIHYNDDGSIAPVTINAAGVGPHNVTGDPIVPAQNYHKLSGPGSKTQGATQTALSWRASRRILRWRIV